jgi:HEAT repeat protein
MPFIKRTATTPPKSKEDHGISAPETAGLQNPDPEVRWSTARTLGGVASAVPALAAALEKERTPRVREALMTALMRTGNNDSVLVLIPYLRSQDAGLRVAAIEALQALPEAIMPFMTQLLSDNDSDVRILATELARNMPAKEATRVLCNLLETESHSNVCGAAIEVLAEVGTRDALPTLKTCAERFSNIPFLSFAVATTIARIAGTES